MQPFYREVTKNIPFLWNGLKCSIALYANLMKKIIRRTGSGPDSLLLPYELVADR